MARIFGRMTRLFGATSMSPTHPSAPRRLQTTSDLSVPSAQTELLLSPSLLEGAATIQGALLNENGEQKRVPAQKRPLHAKLRRRPREIKLELQ